MIGYAIDLCVWLTELFISVIIILLPIVVIAGIYTFVHYKLGGDADERYWRWNDE